MSTACLASAGRPVAHARAAHARRARAGSTANGGTRRFTARSRRRGDVTTCDAAAASGTASAASSASSPFERLESLLSSAAEATAPSDARGWRELEGTWVLSPPDPAADQRAVVHFCGGAFVGASPQLTYRLFLERLCARANVTIVATPFAIGFEHLRIADDAQFAFDRALRALVAEDATRYASIPTFGVGHSMGALLHSIIGARYELANSTRRCGNALMSFNNKPATDAIPAFAEAVAPGIQALSPVLSAALNNPVSVFLVIFGYFWLFLVILVWAIRLTSCFLFTGERFFTKRRRRVRSIVCFRARCRPGAAAGAGPDRAGVHGGCERRGGVCAETGGYQGAHSGALFGS